MVNTRIAETPRKRIVRRADLLGYTAPSYRLILSLHSPSNFGGPLP